VKPTPGTLQGGGASFATTHWSVIAQSRDRLTFLSIELSYFLFSFLVEIGLRSLLTKGKSPNGFRKNKIPFLGARNSACLL
jgi:hypothetical protein